MSLLHTAFSILLPVRLSPATLPMCQAPHALTGRRRSRSHSYSRVPPHTVLGSSHISPHTCHAWHHNHTPPPPHPATAPNPHPSNITQSQPHHYYPLLLPMHCRTGRRHSRVPRCGVLHCGGGGLATPARRHIGCGPHGPRRARRERAGSAPLQRPATELLSLLPARWRWCSRSK